MVLTIRLERFMVRMRAPPCSAVTSSPPAGELTKFSMDRPLNFAPVPAPSQAEMLVLEQETFAPARVVTVNVAVSITRTTFASVT